MGKKDKVEPFFIYRPNFKEVFIEKIECSGESELNYVVKSSNCRNDKYIRKDTAFKTANEARDFMLLTAEKILFMLLDFYRKNN
jgi:hypothetical protein